MELRIPGAARTRKPAAETQAAAAFGVPHDLGALRALVEGAARRTGQEFLQALVRQLALAVDAHYALVAEFAELQTRVHSLAFWARDHVHDNIEFDFRGTPCEDVVRGRLCHHQAGVAANFPQSTLLVQAGIESYLGVPLHDGNGEVLGHLAVFDERPMPADPRRLVVFRIFAALAASELKGLYAERRLRESEQRYRDLYEEAPVGYLSVRVDGRIISVNRRAVQLAGYSREEMIGLPVLDLCADTASGKARAAEAFRRFLAGEELSGLELEMRRKDGSPLWISLWVKPVRGRDGQIKASRSVWVDITDRVLAEAAGARLHEQNVYLQEEIRASHNFEEILGQSPALLAVLESVRRVAPTGATVLISGETGTGKELIARAIHSTSTRKDKPLITVNCAALPASLVESELFGHEKGSFTGAVARRLGRFELADGGTIFLDEVGELPAGAQAKLLRTLQEHEFERVGGSAPIKVDVRVIAATNRDLAKAVRETTFREDLYYRLDVFPIHIPPLRERAADIPLLVQFLVNKFAVRIGKRLDGVGRQTMQQLMQYPWPGNIRELENVLERAVILATGNKLEIEADTVATVRPTPDAAGPRSLETVERSHILAVVQQANWVIDGPRGAARILGLHPNTLRNRMKKLGITRPSHHIS
jgi:PAS domain S-box-containing protein